MGSQTKVMKTVASLGVLSIVGQVLSQVNYQGGAGGGFGGSFGSPAGGASAGGSLENTIPGTPGEDYPIYAVPPETSFSCDGQVDGGYYGDPEAECQAFHICANDGNSGLTKFSFLCPNGTLFQQQYFVCDWWFNVDCSTTEDFYGLNDQIAASSPGGGQGQYGGARSSGARGQSSGRRGASVQYSGGKSGTGKKSRKGSQASASAPRGSYSSPSGSSSSYSAPSSGYQGGQDTSGAGSGYGSPSDFGGSSGADAAYGAPPGYSRRRNARGTNLVVEEPAEEKGEEEEE